MWHYWAPQLSALALIDAHRAGSYQDVESVLTNTPPTELHIGLVQLCAGLICSLAAQKGVSPEEMTETFRRGMLAASVA